MLVQIKQENQFYIFPLIEKEGLYFLNPEPSINDIINHSTIAFLDYLKNNYHNKVSLVSIHDKVFKTSVYFPNDEDDFSYIILNNDFIPYGTTNQPDIYDQYLSSYLDKVSEKLKKSDFILPEQSTYLDSQFIYPRFEKLINFNTVDFEIDWQTLLSLPKVVLVGEPGSGKTTCLRKIALELTKQNVNVNKSNIIPIYIQLRNLYNYNNLFHHIQYQLRSEEGEWINDNLEILIRSGKILLLLDGLDEIPDNARRNILSDIQNLNTDFPTMKIFLTTRKQTGFWNLQNFSYVGIKPLNNSQIKEICYRRLYKKKSWKDFYSSLMEVKEIEELSRTPLLLIITIFLYYRNSILPYNRSQVIKDYILALTETWDSARGINRDIDSEFTPIRTRLYLSKLAYYCKDNNIYSFNETDLEKCFIDRHNKVNTLDILSKISEKTGLLNKDEKDGWSFIHASILDYFASSYLVEKCEGLGRVFKHNYNDDRWSAIWYNTGGLTTDPEYLINLYKNNKSLTTNEKIIHTLNITLQSISIEGKVIDSYLKSILLSIENILRYFTVSCISKNSTGKKTQQIFELKLTAKKKAITYELTNFSIELIHGIYKNRLIYLKDYFINTFNSKNEERYDWLVKFLQQKGNLVIKEKQKEGKKIIMFMVYIESPDIIYE